jgi:hypothetical protein
MKNNTYIHFKIIKHMKKIFFITAMLAFLTSAAFAQQRKGKHHRHHRHHHHHMVHKTMGKEKGKM